MEFFKKYLLWTLTKVIFWWVRIILESMADQNGMVLIAVHLGDHELIAFHEILNLSAKMQKIQLFIAVCDFCLAKNATFSKSRNNDLNLNKLYKVGRERFCAFCRRCFFSTEQTIWYNVEGLCFHNWAQFAVFQLPYFCVVFGQTSIERFFIPMVWFNREYVNRAPEKVCPRVSTTFIAGASTCDDRFLNFQLEPRADALMLADCCWEINMAQSQSLIWLIFCGNSKRVWHMCLILKVITSNRCFQLWFVAKFFAEKETMRMRKNGVGTQVILRSFHRLDWQTPFLDSRTCAWLST